MLAIWDTISVEKFFLVGVSSIDLRFSCHSFAGSLRLNSYRRLLQEVHRVRPICPRSWWDLRRQAAVIIVVSWIANLGFSFLGYFCAVVEVTRLEV